MDDIEQIERLLNEKADVNLAILFGSVARGNGRTHSDLDIGIAGPEVLSPDQKLRLVDLLGAACGRPVDLVDLRTAPPVLLTRILTKGKRLVNKDRALYESLISKMIYANADLMPYINRILKERRERFMRG